MKQLVILGLGARSTLFYQRLLHELYFNITGNYATLPFILKQLDFNAINPFLPDNATVISPILERELSDYNSFEFILLVPNITIHEILDAIEFDLSIIHPYQLLVDELAHKATKTLVFFGTKFTNSNSYIASYITDQSIGKLSNEEVLFLDDLRQNVYAHTETDDNVIDFNRLITKYSKTHLVVIACTELSIINTNNDEDVIDLVRLQCQKSIVLLVD